MTVPNIAGLMLICIAGMITGRHPRYMLACVLCIIGEALRTLR